MGRNELYIGNLSRDVQSREIESIFKKHGKVLRCEVKNKGYGSVYAFIEFDDERDAEDALNHENGKDLLGSPMVVEFTKGKGRRGTGYRGSRDRRDLECYECGERGHFARDCRRRGGGRYRDRSRDRRRDRSRSRDRRSRSKSRDRYKERSRERSESKRDKKRERSEDKSSSPN